MSRSSTASVPGRIPFGVGAVVVLALFAMFPAHAIRADRERVRFIVRHIVQPPERPDDPLAENAG